LFRIVVALLYFLFVLEREGMCPPEGWMEVGDEMMG
jgi:hypothetical protein